MMKTSLIIIKNVSLCIFLAIAFSVLLAVCLKYLGVNKDYAIDSILTPLVLALCFYTGAKTAIEINQ